MDYNNSGDYQWDNNEKTQKLDGYNNEEFDNANYNGYNNYNNNYNNYGNYGNYNNGYRKPSNKGGANIVMIFLLALLCIAMVGVIIVGLMFLNDSNNNNGGTKTTQVVQKKKDSDKKEVMYIASSNDEVDFLSAPDNKEDNVIDTIPVGSKVTFIENENSSYAKVEYDSMEGYVERKFLTDKKPKGNDTEDVDDAEREKEEEILERTPEPTVSPAQPTPSSDVVTRYVYVANVAYSIYLRSTPYETNNIICEIPVGTKVGYIGPANGTFSKIKYGSYVGYSKTQYLSNYAPSVSYGSSSRYMTVCNVAYSIYLRSAPVENQSNIICEIPVGSTVEFIDGGNGTFYKIRWNGRVGYSKSAYLR